MRRRRFHPRVYAEIIAAQKNVCACGCGEPLDDIRQVDFDHVIALADGGEDSPDNLQAVIRKHHRFKSAREATRRAKIRRIEKRGGGRKLTAMERAIDSWSR